MKVRPTILVVDDDPVIRSLFVQALTGAGFDTVESEDGMDALERANAQTPALIVLDVEMPRMNGWKTLAELRRRGCTQPILMITHVNDVDSRVHGLETGADDYIGKPCLPTELIARVRALLRRSPLASSRRLRFGDIVVDLDGKKAERAGQPLRITRTEFALLELLFRNAGKPVSREAMLEHLWGARSGTSHTIDTHLWRLRKKLGDAGDTPRWIQNVAGFGYVLSPETARDARGK